jgi:hypothetical protein
VKDARVLRRLPDQLEVRIIEHEPLATIRSNRIFALTAEGIVLPVPAAEWVWNLPLLTPPQALTLSPGGQIKDQSTLEFLRQVVDVREAAPAIWSNLSELYFHSKEIRATLLDPPVILRMQRVNEHRTWLALQELLDKEFDQDDQHNKVMTIDLRIPGNIILQSPEIAQLAQETPNP